MATINDSRLIAELLRDNGHYPGDPQLYAIFSYTNDWNKLTWAICAVPIEVIGYLASPHIHDLQLLWSCDYGLTERGLSLLHLWYPKKEERTNRDRELQPQAAPEQE
jgi:hypothetical protein